MPSRSLLTAVLVAVAVAWSPSSSAHADTWASRPPLTPTADELRLALRKLSVLGSVLYVNAHPDDENTALLSYLSRDRLARVGYLSLTRGDGGQNLIGSEIGEALGVIRTQELLEARRVDGAEQFFTRAVDFGYSKSSDEALRIWGHEEILADVVWIIRTFRPDVIVTRAPAEGRTHGHHTAASRLAQEAFAAAADPTRFPEQLGPRVAASGRKVEVTPWQVKRVVWNLWRPTIEGRDPGLPPLISVDVGTFNPHLGKAYTEIAAESRSMHKSQGFGSRSTRGTRLDYFEHALGEQATEDLMDGVDTSWGRVEGASRVQALLREAEMAFDADDPGDIVPTLLRVRAAMDETKKSVLEMDDPWVDQKRADLDRLIRQAAGLWLEAVAERPSVSPGDSISLTLTAVLRSSAKLTLERVSAFGPALGSAGEALDRALEPNQPVTWNVGLRLAPDAPLVTQPYWLREPGTKGRFEVNDRALLGRPETPPICWGRFVIVAGDQRISYDEPFLYREVDRVIGERYRRVQIVPPATARLEETVRVFPDAAPRDVNVVVRAHRDGAEGLVRLRVPAGWRVEPPVHDFVLEEEGAERRLKFTLYPPRDASVGDVIAEVSAGGPDYSHGLIRIDYPHIPAQDLFPTARARVVRTPIRRRGEHVGYVMGSGDRVPEALREVGFQVTLLTDDDVAGAALDGFDAIVVGVRAYNTRPRLRALQPRLLEYVSSGGTLVVQYNTRHPALNDRLGPYPFTISRDRVSVEEAPVSFRNPEHPLLAAPNRIRPSDFEGWVQERGLYFANPFDERYDTVLSSHDPGEAPLEGGLLYARYGDGVFIYTGYSFFRELPAGVPGAYRLFVNLVSARP